MKRFSFIFLSLITLAVFVASAHGDMFYLALLGKKGDLDPDIQNAYDWAKANYETTFLFPAGGEFLDASGHARSLRGFSVVWWHQGRSEGPNAPSEGLPESFTDSKTMNAVKAYVEDGGSVLLTGEALAYVHDMGIEPMEARMLDIWGQEYTACALPTDEGKEHPIFKGFDKETAVCCADTSTSTTADFYNKPGEPEGVLLADSSTGAGKAGTERPIIEYTVGDGKIIVCGWRLTMWADDNNEFRSNLEQLTTNMLEYLKEMSAFMAVSPVSELPETWGKLKLEALQD